MAGLTTLTEIWSAPSHEGYLKIITFICTNKKLS